MEIGEGIFRIPRDGVEFFERFLSATGWAGSVFRIERSRRCGSDRITITGDLGDICGFLRVDDGELRRRCAGGRDLPLSVYLCDGGTASRRLDGDRCPLDSGGDTAVTDDVFAIGIREDTSPEITCLEDGVGIGFPCRRSITRLDRYGRICSETYQGCICELDRECSVVGSLDDVSFVNRIISRERAMCSIYPIDGDPAIYDTSCPDNLCESDRTWSTFRLTIDYGNPYFIISWTDIFTRVNLEKLVCRFATEHFCIFDRTVTVVGDEV